MEKKESKIFYGWWIVLVCTWGLFVAYGSRFYSFGVFFKPMMKDLGWTRAMTASAFGVSTILYGLLSPVVGKLIDKYGPRYVISTGAFVGGIGFMLCYFTTSLVQFYIFYTVIMTLGISMTGIVSTNAAVAKWFTKKRSFVMGIVAAGLGLGAVVLVPIAGWLVSNFGWRISFIYMGFIVWIPLLPLALILLRAKPEDMGLLPDGDKEATSIANPATAGSSPQPKAAPVTWTLKEAMGTSAFWLMSVNIFIFLLVYMAFVIHVVPYATDIGHSGVVAAFAISLLTACSIPAKLVGGWLGDRINIKIILIAGFVIMILALVVFPNIFGVKSLFNFYFFVICMGVSYGMIWPLLPSILSKLYGAPSTGVVWGGVIMLAAFGGGVGPVFAGWTYDVTKSYSLAFLYGAVFLILGTALLFFVKQPKKKEMVS
jgi:MFS family permease